MHKLIIFVLAGVLWSAPFVSGIDDISGQDMYMSGEKAVVSTENGTNIFVFENGISISLGDNRLSAARGVVWVEQLERENLGIVTRDYKVRAYLEEDVDLVNGDKSRTTRIDQHLVERGQSLFVSFLVTGQVYITSPGLLKEDVTTMDIYRKASSIILDQKVRVRIVEGAKIPGVVPPPLVSELRPDDTEKDSSVLSKIVPTDVRRESAASTPDEPAEKYKYPVNIAALWKPAPVVERSVTADGVSIVTIEGRFYIWQKLNDKGAIIEFQADNAVVFYSSKDLKVGQEQTGRADMLVGGDIDSVYIDGDIIMTEGDRTIKADRLFYDFNTRQALAENAEMRRFNADRSIPLYLRAQRLLKLNDQVFTGEGIVMTSDEFYLPQLSAQASSIVITDTGNLDDRENNAKYQARMKDVSIKYRDVSIFKLGTLKSDLERPELPIKRVRVGSQTTFGSFVETRWYLARVLGYQEPEDTDSTLSLDYYSKRGFGAGAAFDYETENYFGAIDSYIIKDHGEDRLGDADSLKDIEPDRDIRGRFRMVHREYLPDDWQLTGEVSYLSDRNFLQSFYRNEYYTSKEQETLLHLKRTTDNWAVSWLAKVRINDFEDYLEESPSFEYHRTGQDLWDSKLTYYTDTQISRMRNRNDDDFAPTLSEEYFTYAYTRHEVDMPFAWGLTKYVPYVAGSYVFDDGEDFASNLNGGTDDFEKDFTLGEAGIRVSTLFWNTDQFRRSELWDINGVRHYIRPHLEAALYKPSDSGIDMRNMLNLGLAQTWQTRRGEPDNLRTVDWMKLNLNTTFVSDSSLDYDQTDLFDKQFDAVGQYSSVGLPPSSFIFNNPAIPFFNRRYTQYYGLQRNTLEGDYSWKVSDTLAVSSYLNSDIESGVVQQFNFGVTRYCWPSVSYYLGSRYLRRLEITGPNYEEKGSNALDFAITYDINPRYTFIYAQEYNFSYGQNIDSEVTLIRKYNRLFYGLTYRNDAYLSSNSVVFSVWPEGIKELAIGSRTYIGLTGPTSYQ